MYAALLALTTKLKPQQGTAIFIKMISDWSAKDKYKCIRLNDDLRVPWSLNCESFIHLNKACDIVASCEWQGGSSHQRKLTKFTALLWTCLIGMLEPTIFLIFKLCRFCCLAQNVKTWKTHPIPSQLDFLKTF